MNPTAVKVTRLFRRSVRVDVDVKATPEKIWSLLTNVADAPRWMAVVLALWWLALLMLFVWLQLNERCIDTYQAIWGPDSRHPGNQRKPIGWGIRRPMA